MCTLFGNCGEYGRRSLPCQTCIACNVLPMSRGEGRASSHLRHLPPKHPCGSSELGTAKEGTGRPPGSSSCGSKPNQTSTICLLPFAGSSPDHSTAFDFASVARTIVDSQAQTMAAACRAHRSTYKLVSTGYRRSCSGS